MGCCGPGSQGKIQLTTKDKEIGHATYIEPLTFFFFFFFFFLIVFFIFLFFTLSVVITVSDCPDPAPNSTESHSTEK